MLFIFGVVTMYHKSLMHIKSKLTPYQERLNLVIFVLMYLIEIPTDLSHGEYALAKDCHH